jgi:hypothetical protein
MRLMLLAGLLALPLTAQALPLQSVQEMNEHQRVCEWALMHNARGIYFPQGLAERICACGTDLVSQWVRDHRADNIPPEVERGAGVSCMREVGRGDQNRT